MGEENLYVREVGKRKSRQKCKKTFPTIKRDEIMTGILETDLDKYTRSRLSNLYAEITYIEMLDLKYMSEIVVSSKEDLELYNILKKYNKQKKYLKKQVN